MTALFLVALVGAFQNCSSAFQTLQIQNSQDISSALSLSAPLDLPGTPDEPDVPVVNSPAGIYVDCKSGNDSHDGTSPEKAFKSLQQTNNKTLSSGEGIFVRRGSICRGQLSPKISAAFQGTLKIQAYGMETDPKPQIRGSIPLASSFVKVDSLVWKGQQIVGSQGKPIYSATMTDPLILQKNMTQLIYANERMQLARSPNAGLSFPVQDNVFESDPSKNQDYLQADIPHLKTYGLGPEEKVIVRIQDWIMNTRKIIDFNSSNGYFTISPRITDGYRATNGSLAGFGMIFFNSLPHLDQSKEWYYDNQTKTFYFWSPSGGPPDINLLEVSVYGQRDQGLIHIQARTDIDVNVEQIDVLHSAGDGITVSNANNITIRNVGVYFSHERGISFYKNSIGRLIQTEIANSESNGFSAYDLSVVEVESSNFAQNGILGAQNEIDMDLNGIRIAAVPQVTIKSSTFKKHGFAGIMLSGSPEKPLQSFTVEANNIEDSCEVLNDCGGFYVNGTYTVTGKIIANTVAQTKGNLVGAPNGYSLKAPGIYLDWMASRIEVRGNTVRSSRGIIGGIFNHGGGQNSYIGNNIDHADSNPLVLIRDVANQSAEKWLENLATIKLENNTCSSNGASRACN